MTSSTRNLARAVPTATRLRNGEPAVAVAAAGRQILVTASTLPEFLTELQTAVNDVYSLADTRDEQ